MDDAALVGGAERLGQLQRDGERGINRKAAFLQPRRERVALDVLENDDDLPVASRTSWTPGDIGVAQRRRGPRFAQQLSRADAVSAPAPETSSARPGVRAAYPRRGAPYPCRPCRVGEPPGTGRFREEPASQR